MNDPIPPAVTPIHHSTLQQYDITAYYNNNMISGSLTTGSIYIVHIQLINSLSGRHLLLYHIPQEMSIVLLWNARR